MSEVVKGGLPGGSPFFNECRKFRLKFPAFPV